MRAGQPRSGDRVRHATTGDVGTLDHYFRPDAYGEWAMVRWDKGRQGPGMYRQSDGLSHVAPGLLERHRSVS